MYRILIVEDDHVIAKAVADYLNQWGYEAHPVTELDHVLDQFAAESPHLVLMDISLPFYNGYYWCAEIRKLSKVPIIFLSSASDNMNIVMAMNMGGDDFISKPFDLDVLLAKVQAMLRRSYSFQGQSSFLEHNGAILNLSDASLMVGSRKVELAKNEFRILQVLLENAGKVVTREQLMKRLWEDDSFVDDNTLTVNVTRLRHRLEDAGLTDWIQTKKGVGYLIS